MPVITQEASSDAKANVAKKRDACLVEMITCSQCKKTLEASNFAKAQLKKFKKNRPCFCVQCSRNKRGGKADIKVDASSSGGSAGRGVCTCPIVECISFE